MPETAELMKPAINSEVAFNKIVEAGWCEWDGLEFRVNRNATIDQWMTIGNILQSKHEAVQLMLGDWINFGHKKYGEKYAQALSELNVNYGSARNWAYTSGRINPANRNPRLSYSHHKVVARLPPIDQRKMLEKSEKEKLSVSQLKEIVYAKFPIEERFRKDRLYLFSEWLEEYAQEIDVSFTQRDIDHMQRSWDFAIRKGRKV